MDIKEALLSVADDIESGKLTPGKDWFWDAKRQPCCTVGHVASRVDPAHSIEVNLKDCVDVLVDWIPIANANDRGDWPEVVRMLRAAGAVF